MPETPEMSREKLAALSPALSSAFEDYDEAPAVPGVVEAAQRITAEYVERAVPTTARVTEARPTPRPMHEQMEEQVRALLAQHPPHPDADLLENMMLSALKLGRDGASRAELKILSAALREMRYAFRVFRPYTGRRKVSVFGSARTPRGTPDYVLARDFAAEMVRRDYMVITGAGPGIMEAAQEGAGRKNSFGMNIRLPFEQAANPFIIGDPKLVYFRYFFTRKLCFVREASGIALFPGGLGTMDEGFETLTLIQTGKAALVPVVLVEQPGGEYWTHFVEYLREHLQGQGMICPSDLGLLKLTHSVTEAADEITRFYRRYHSSRFVKDMLVIRMSSPLPEGALERLNAEFARILVPGAGPIRTSGALEDESDQPELAALPRLVLPFNRRDHGVLRQVIDVLNEG